jgi:hypothetical protein
MKTQLDAMVEFLSGREGEETDRIRLELADPESDTARFLYAACRLSSEMFTPHLFKSLGLPLSARDHVPDVPRPQSPPSAGRRLLRILPWLTTALASGAVLWLMFTCPCNHAKPDEPDQVALAPNPRITVSPPAPRLPAVEPGPDGKTGDKVPSPPRGPKPTQPPLDSSFLENLTLGG